MNNWTTLDPTANIMQMGQETTPNSLAGIGFTPEFLRQIGYTGPDPMSYRNGENAGVDPAFIQFLQSKGSRLANSATPRTTRGTHGTTDLGAFDAQGNQIANQSGSQDDGSTGAALGALALAGGFGAATLAGAGAAGAAGGTSTGTGGGLTADQLAYGSLENGAAYGSGAGDSLVASSEPGFGGALGGGGMTDAEAQAAAAASDAGGGALGGTPAVTSSTGGFGGLLGSLGSGVSSLGSAAGSALGSLSAGQVAGLVGAGAGLLGNGSGLNSATQSTQNKVDPRVAQYIYGQDGNSGLLGNVNSVYQQQLAQGGLNDTQKQGLAMQKAVLTDPGYSAGFNQMRSVGQGLLSQPQAGNPFMTGQAVGNPSPYAPRMQIPRGLLGA